MNKRITFLAIFLLSLMTVFYSCNKDDETATTDDETQTELNISVESANVKTFELISVIRTSEIDLMDTYLASFGDIEISLQKVTDSTLVFIVPDIESGNYLLKTELGNIDFNVNKTIVSNPEEIILGYIKEVEANFTPTLEQPKSKGAEILNNILANTTDEEKKAIAMYFESNKDVFNNILNKSETAKRTITIDLNKRVGRYHIHVFQLGIGAVAVVGASTLGASGVGAIIAGAGLGLIYDAIPDIINDGNGMINEGVRQVDFDIVENSVNKKMTQKVTSTNSISFINKAPKVLTASYDIRSLEQSDRALNDIYFFNAFFESFDALNSIIIRVNSAISIVNKIPFVNIETFNTGNIPESGGVKTENISHDNFSNYSFSIENSKININASLKEEGKVEITLTADESLDLSEALEAQMIITYKDEFNDLTKTISATISSADPCIDNNAPIITSISVDCDDNNTGYNVTINFTADGIGFDYSGSYFGSLTTYPDAYPVRLAFDQDISAWSHGANSYFIQQTSGDKFGGTLVMHIPFGITRFCSPTGSYQKPEDWNGNWRVSLVDDCNLTSNYETFRLTRYRFGTP